MMDSYHAQFFFMYSLAFLLYYLLLGGSFLFMSFISVKLLNKTTAKSDTNILTRKHSHRLFGYSILSFFIAFIIVFLISECFKSSDMYEGLENLFTYILVLPLIPDYSESGSVLFVLSITGISFLLNLIFDFFLAFRKTELTMTKRFLCALISAAMVSPYVLLISFNFFLG